MILNNKKEVIRGDNMDKNNIILCPDCDKNFLEFVKITAEGIIFFCGYCRKNVTVTSVKPEYLRNRVIILKKEYPARERL